MVDTNNNGWQQSNVIIASQRESGGEAVLSKKENKTCVVAYTHQQHSSGPTHLFRAFWARETFCRALGAGKGAERINSTSTIVTADRSLFSYTYFAGSA